MALIHCPECNREISDRAAMCPNCGYPLAGTYAAVNAPVGDAVISNRPLVSEQVELERHFRPIGFILGLILIGIGAYFLITATDDMYRIGGGIVAALGVFEMIFGSTRLERVLERKIVTRRHRHI